MNPILSIDVSKSNSYATAFLFNSKSVTSYFMNHGYDVVVLNPLQTHEFKKKLFIRLKLTLLILIKSLKYITL